MSRMKFVSALLALGVLLAACAPAATQAPTAIPTTAPAPTATEAAAPTQAPAAASQTIVDVAVADGRFGTLVAAVQAAGLAETLSGPGPFTVFAPTDEAFAKLPAGTLDELLKPENKQKLADILTYHVVPGGVFAADVVKLMEATTVLGKNVAIQVTDGKVYINGAQVIIADVKASNGVIHVIDAVLLPPA